MTLEGLNGLIKGLESQESWQAQKQFRLVLQHWPKSVGFAVARKTRPIAIQRGTLYVATATAAWANTLAYERLNILQKLNRYQHKPLKNIRFSTAQWAESTDTARPTQAKVQHPSYVGEVPHLPKIAPQTPSEAFQRWAKAVQQIQLSQALCPQCQCRCPQGEIDRWGACALCTTKHWK